MPDVPISPDDDRFPRFTPKERDGDGVVGTLDRTRFEGKPWVRDGWLGDLVVGDTVVAGRWHGKGRRWRFVPERRPFEHSLILPEGRDDVATLLGEPRWLAFDGYWGARVRLLTLPLDAWHRLAAGTPEWNDRFPLAAALASDASCVAGPAEEAMAHGWGEHEHCVFCNESMSPVGAQAGWSNDPEEHCGEWACDACFEKTVRPRSLAFLF